MVGRFKQALLEKGDMSGMTQKGGHKRSTESGAGLTQKGVEKYRRQNPGSKLKTAVTTPPSKLKPGSKAAKRRKSFCARSRGWTGERGKAARRRWNCSTDANPSTLDRMVEMILERFSPEMKRYQRLSRAQSLGSSNVSSKDVAAARAKVSQKPLTDAPLQKNLDKFKGKEKTPEVKKDIIDTFSGKSEIKQRTQAHSDRQARRATPERAKGRTERKTRRGEGVFDRVKRDRPIRTTASRAFDRERRRK
jgi:hypothetical protein